MTIIFSNHQDEDCRILSKMWQGLDNINLVEILPGDDDYEKRVEEALTDEEDILVLVGHGTIYGLLHPNFREYIIHENNVRLIHARKVVCCWCNASTFCEQNHLKAFATSMFISNVSEAYDYAIHCATQEEINATDEKIYGEIMSLATSDTPVENWTGLLTEAINDNDAIDRFNREGLTLIH